MTPPEEPDVVLVLRVQKDPAACHGTPARTGAYRLKLALKLLLRAFGLRCLSVSDVKTQAKEQGKGGPLT